MCCFGFEFFSALMIPMFVSECSMVDWHIGNSRGNKSRRTEVSRIGAIPQVRMENSKSGRCGELPVEITERVLSFLPVPDLCRLRSVCKAWSEVISRPSFHALCDINGPSNLYLFVWKRHSRRLRGAFAPSTTGSFTFLDANARRWYSIQVAEPPRVSEEIVARTTFSNEIETRLMATDDGLVVELNRTRFTGHNSIALADPVANTRTILPALPQFYSSGGPLPHVVTTVDGIANSYKVFILNSLCQEVVSRETLPKVYVHEACTDQWREQRMAQDHALCAFQAVAVHHSVFLSKRILSYDYEFDEVALLRYNPNPNEDAWAEAWRMSFPRYIVKERLVLSGNRLFLLLWTVIHPRTIYNPLLETRDCPDFDSLFQSNQDYPEMLFEVYEALVAENGRKPVVQLTDAQLKEIFGRDYDVACAFPCFDSSGMCDSVALVRESTGEVRRYYLATGSVDELPLPPLVLTSEELQSVKLRRTGSCRCFLYDAKTTKLSLRNLLGQNSTSA